MTDYPGEQFPPAVDPDVEPGYEPEPDEQSQPDYDTEPEPESQYRPSNWVNPTLQGRPHTDPLLAGFTVYGDPTPEPPEDTEQAFEASLETQHSFVDDGPEDWPDNTPTEEPPAAATDEPDEALSAWGSDAGASSDEAGEPPVHAEEAAPSSAEGEASRPAVPTPGQAFGRGPVPTPGQVAPRPAAPVSAPAAVVPEVDEDGVHPLVEETMGRLEELRERPVGEHAEVFADLHERLQSALVEADAEHGDRG